MMPWAQNIFIDEALRDLRLMDERLYLVLTIKGCHMDSDSGSGWINFVGEVSLFFHWIILDP